MATSVNTLNSFAKEVVSNVSRSWWILLVRGIALVVLGIYAFLQPGMTVLVLTTVLGAYTLVDGVFALIGGIAGWSESRMWSIIGGLLGVVVGGFVLLQPAVAAGIGTIVLLTFVALRSILIGAIEIFSAIRFRKVMRGEGFLIFTGVLSVILGVIVLMNPVLSLAVLIPIIAILAVIYGVAMIVLAFRVRNLPNQFA